MASKSNFFGKLLGFFLIIIIVGGVGFLGYNYLSGSNGSINILGMNIGTDGKTSDTSNTETNSSDSSNHAQMNMGDSSSENSVNVEESSTEESTGSQYSTPIISAVVNNKDNLQKTLTILEDSLSLMTLDPYGNETDTDSGANQNQEQEDNGQTKTTDEQGNTIVNVYPQNSTSQFPSMDNMGTTYDAAKMEQLHLGQYKVAIGMQLLGQLKDNLSTQLEQASMEVSNPSQYYYNQYLLTVHNKNKLHEALTYINEASSLININPYVSQTGLVYDNNKMENIHESIKKLAEAVVGLNKINDNLSTQSIELTNLAQNAPTMTSMNMNTTGSSFFGNVNMAFVFNALVIVFIVIFIISILGYIGKLLKAPKSSN